MRIKKHFSPAYKLEMLRNAIAELLTIAQKVKPPAELTLADVTIGIMHNDIQTMKKKLKRFIK